MEFDLFAVGIISRIEGDRDFEDAHFFLEDFSGEFRLKVEAIGVDSDAKGCRHSGLGLVGVS